MQEQLISFSHTQSSLFIRSMSNDPTEAPTKPGWGSKVARQYFAFSIGLCAALIVVPFLIVFLDRWLANAAPWRFRHHHRTHNPKRLVEWWYDWTGKKCTAHTGQNCKDMREFISYMLHWRYTTKNYDWWFWDPDGSGAKGYEKRRNCSVLRHLPQWAQSRGCSGDTPKGRTCDLEQGRPTISAASAPLCNDLLGLVGEVWAVQEDGPYRRAFKQVSMELMRAALPDPRYMRDASAARQCSIRKRELPLWQTGNEEINVATNKQLLGSRNYHRGSIRVPNKPALFTRHCSEGPASNLGNVAMNATLKRPDSLTSGKLTINTTECSIPPHQSQRLLWTTVDTSLYLPGSRTPPNSVNIARTTRLETFTKLVKHMVQDMPFTVLSSMSEQRDLVNVSNLQGSCWRPKLIHMITNQDTWDRSHDMTRKTGDPAACWTQNQASGYSFDVLSTYEAGESPDEAISQCYSSASTRSEMARLCHYCTLWYHQASLAANCRLTSELKKTGKGSCIGAYGILSDISHRPTRTLSATAFTPLRRRRAVDRGVCVSFSKGPSEAGDRQDFAVSRSSQSEFPSYSSSTILMKRLPIRPSSPLSSVSIASSFHSLVGKTRNNEPLEYSIALPGPHELIMREPESPTNHQHIMGNAESISVHDLGDRLNRLQYELSPGFRGPKSVFCDSWAIDAPMFRPNFQVQLRSRKAFVSSKGDAQTPAARTSTVTQREAIKFVNLFDWRTAVNETRKRTGCENISCQPYIPIREEEGFDTAAWILRRPPQGSETDFGPPITLYAGTFGRRRTLAEWNAQTASKRPRRTSSEADLPEHPAKALRVGFNLVKGVMEKKKNGWFPQVRSASAVPGLNCTDLPNEIIIPLLDGAKGNDQST